MTLLPYIRVSTDDQENSLEMQLATIQRYCISNGYDMGEVFADEDVSAYIEIGKRPMGAKLLDELSRRKGQEVGVVSIKVDRMFRNSIDAMVTAKQWNTDGIPLFIVSMGGNSLNTSTSIGWLFFQTLVMFAEFERNQISERTKAVKQHLKDNLRKNGIIPYGWRTEDGDNLLPDKHESDVVRDIFSMRDDGTSLHTIAHRLNDKGIRTRNGNEFQPTTVKRILEYQPNTKLI